jgi:hypothetical protein
MDNESAVNEQQRQLPTADAAAAVNESLISASTTEEPASSSSTQQQQPLVGIKRKRPSNNNTTIIDLHTFQHSPHSLRISASSVSALCGLHPYQNLPQLFFDLVYQSHLGQLLLQTDASLLGLTIVDAQSHEQNQMLAMASSISNETRQLVQTAINVSNGTTKLQSVEDVQSIQHQIQINALQSGKLTKREVNTLVEASRGNMSTGFGNAHEEDALDLYEKVVGCRVRERNEALMTWKFERVVTKNDNDEERNTKEMGYCGVTARPMGDARRREWGEMMSIVNNNLEKANDGKNDDDDDAKPENEKEKEDKGVEVIDLSDDTTTTPSSEQNHHKCFFKIVGAVDGIRDEIYIDKTPPPPPRMSSTDDNNATSDTKSTNIPNSKHNTPSNNKNAPKSNDDEYNFSDDDDNNEQWTVRPIIVECKHRMSQAKVPPPLYDQIQTCLYMNMYKVDDADLIQVVRRNTKRMTTTTTTPAIKKDYDDEGAEGKENDQPMKKANDDTTMTKANNNNNNNGEKKTKEGNHNVQITISRISLNDPIHNHQYHWNETLLPRLASFVDAVYNVRKDDGKRYRLLMALVEEQNGCGHKGDQSNEEAWKILWDEMPWLRLCDTSFGRGRR